MNEYYNRFGCKEDLSDVNAFLQEFLDSHCVNSVQFSYTEYDETDGTGEGTRTTIEKCRYTVEDFE